MTIGHNSVAGGQLKSIVERVEALEREKKAIADDIRDVYAEAKANGFDTKTIRAVVRVRKQDAAEREEAETMLDLYLNALGMLRGTPLGDAAVTRETGQTDLEDFTGKPGEPDYEAMYQKAVTAVRDAGKVTIALVQKPLQIGYNLAASLIDRMEREGIVSAADAKGKRTLIAEDAPDQQRTESGTAGSTMPPIPPELDRRTNGVGRQPPEDQGQPAAA